MCLEILDDLEYDDSENECGACDNEREKPSSDKSEVADEIDLNKAKPEADKRRAPAHHSCSFMDRDKTLVLCSHTHRGCNSKIYQLILTVKKLYMYF